MSTSERLQRVDGAYGGRLLRVVVAIIVLALLTLAVLEAIRGNVIIALGLVAILVAAPVGQLVGRRYRSRAKV
jgi:hypothetical protein